MDWFFVDRKHVVGLFEINVFDTNSRVIYISEILSVNDHLIWNGSGAEKGNYWDY
tara:strand:- start:443 stop:607 length:165 start_codon:yes stop_codon:yes gene_type:complete